VRLFQWLLPGLAVNIAVFRAQLRCRSLKLHVSSACQRLGRSATTLLGPADKVSNKSTVCCGAYVALWQAAEKKTYPRSLFPDSYSRQAGPTEGASRASTSGTGERWASHGCNTHTQREAGPSRTVPGATSWRHESLGDDAVTPRQAARHRRGSQRWLANSDHRGTCGASLKHRARDAGEKADLLFYQISRCRPRPGAASAQGPRGT
jgi:hypothetical protein